MHCPSDGFASFCIQAFGELVVLSDGYTDQESLAGSNDKEDGKLNFTALIEKAARDVHV